jgi:AbrB family looped-hinge helix DNA binding protein
MDIVTISPKFQVVIPKGIREQMNLRPGQRMQALGFGGRIAFVPVRPIRQMRGYLRGIDTDVPRDPDRV